MRNITIQTSRKLFHIAHGRCPKHSDLNKCFFLHRRCAKKDKKFQDLSENTEGVEMFKFCFRFLYFVLFAYLSVCLPFSFTGSATLYFIPSNKFVFSRFYAFQVIALIFLYKIRFLLLTLFETKKRAKFIHCFSWQSSGSILFGDLPGLKVQGKGSLMFFFSKLLLGVHDVGKMCFIELW